MKNFFALTLIFSSLLVLAPSPMARVAETPEERATRILKEVDDMWRGESSHGFISMRVKTEHYTRSVKLEGWSKGAELTLVRIESPLKEKGTATLKAGESVYSYLPKTDRTIRITSGMMMSSWMGSHFTNDDLVKESRLVDDYHATISFEGERGAVVVLEFTLTPREEAAVVWGAIKTTVRARDNIPIVSVYYDEEMRPVRTMTFEEVKDLGGRTIPSVVRLVPEDRPGEYTELVYEEMEFDIDIPDSFFSLSRLRRQ